MYHTRLAGTYYEMGFKYGKILRKIGYNPPKLPEELKEFANECEKEVKRVFPEIFEEIQGFAEGCSISYEELKSFLLTLGVEKHGCSIFAASNPHPILGRNYDFFYEFKKFSETRLTMPKDGYWSIGDSTVFIGLEDGMNENGLTIAMAFVPQKEIKPGVNWFIAIRAVLDKCSNVKEALKLLSNIKYCTGNNYVLVDQGGDMVVIEASSRKIKVRKPEQGFIVAANHFVHREMRDVENVKERPSTSVKRYKRIIDIINANKGRVDIKLARRILSDHEGSICSHVKQMKFGTLYLI